MEEVGREMNQEKEAVISVTGRSKNIHRTDFICDTGQQEVMDKCRSRDTVLTRLVHDHCLPAAAMGMGMRMARGGEDAQHEGVCVSRGVGVLECVFARGRGARRCLLVSAKTVRVAEVIFHVKCQARRGPARQITTCTPSFP